MRGYDFSPYRRSTVGFDRLFDFLENASRAEQDNYPPFDIEKLGDDTYRITLAVAGFKRDEIDIVAHQNMLTITGRRGETAARTAITCTWASPPAPSSAASSWPISSASPAPTCSDGLLRIELAREIPEAMKPRKIDIGGAAADDDRGAAAGRRRARGLTKQPLCLRTELRRSSHAGDRRRFVSAPDFSSLDLPGWWDSAGAIQLSFTNGDPHRHRKPKKARKAGRIDERLEEAAKSVRAGRPGLRGGRPALLDHAGPATQAAPLPDADCLHLTPSERLNGAARAAL